MKDPVVLVETGQTYDRKYIEEWFGRGNRTCPATKQSVTELNLTTNYALKSLASSWLDVNWGGIDEDGDDGEGGDQIIFDRSSEPAEANDPKKATTSVDDAKTQAKSAMNVDGYPTTIQCGYSRGDASCVSQVLMSAASSVDSTSLIAKKGIESCGASRESYSGKNQLYSSQKEDHKEAKAKCVEGIHSKKQDMQTANVVNPLAAATATNTSINLGKWLETDRPVLSAMLLGALRGDAVRHGVAALGHPSLASKLVHAARTHSKCAEIAEARSADQYDASTPRSTYSDLPRHVSLMGSLSLHNAMQKLEAARRLKFEYDGEEHTPRSTRSANKLLFQTDGKARQCRRKPMGRNRTSYGTPSVCSANSRNSRGEKNIDYQPYEELDKLENVSDAGTEQQPTDEAEEEWMDSADFDARSLSTIHSCATKYASSVMSMKPVMKKGTNICNGFMQGATNVLFGDCDEDEDDGSLSGGEEEDTNDVALPVMVNLLKTRDPELAASVASDLAIRAQTDAALLQDVPRLDVVASLVKILALPSDAARSAAARALGVIGERSPDAKLQMLNCGAIPILSRLNKEAEANQRNDVEAGSLEDMANATRFALSALSRNVKDAPSVDVAPQMLIVLLASAEEDMQASAVLELLEKLNSVYADIVLKELTNSDVLMSLVDMLEHKEEDVQLAAAEIVSRMIYHDQKTQKELSGSIGIVSKLLRLIKQGGSDRVSCRSAAARVIRGLAHNNSKIREDVLKRGVIPEFASLLCCNDPQTRETAAWMLGTMASHSPVTHIHPSHSSAFQTCCCL